MTRSDGRSPRSSSARTRSSSSSSSRSSRAGTACSSACRAWPRRCSSARSRRSLDLTFSRIQFTPDLMPCDITGTEIIEERPGTRHQGVPVRPGPDLRQHRPGRRDQPHAAQDAGRAARGDAGAPGDGGGPDLPARRAVLRARHAEPDRAGRHLPAARSAARPVHVQPLGGLPLADRGGRDREGDDQPAHRIAHAAS